MPPAWKVESIQRSLTGRARVRLRAEWDPTLHETLHLDGDELDRRDVRVGDAVDLLYTKGCWVALKEGQHELES